MTVKDLHHQEESIIYTPSSIISIFSNLIVAPEEKKIIIIKGVYFQKAAKHYAGIWYDELREESAENTITLKVPDLIRSKLSNNTTIQIRSYISKKIDNKGTISIQINLIDLIEQTYNKHTEEDIQKVDIINRKIDSGFRDLESHFKQLIYNNQKPTIKILHGRTAIIDQDIKSQMAESIALYQIEFIPTTISSIKDIINTLKKLTLTPSDVVAISRGGGDIDLKIFDKPELCEFCLTLPSFLVAAIGHHVDTPLLEKISDKKFSTPTAFGQYLKDTYNSSVEEFQKSKAKIVDDVTRQLKANYDKQVSVLNQQITSLNELHIKTLADKESVLNKQIAGLTQQIQNEKQMFTKAQEEAAKNQAEQVVVLNQRIAALTELHAKTIAEKDSLLTKQLTTLNQQLAAEKELHQKTQEEAQKNHAEQVIVLNNKIKAFEDLMAKTITERIKVHQIEIAALRAQILQLNQAHEQQKVEAEIVQRERVSQMNEQISMMQKQQARTEEQLKAAQEEARIARQRADQASSGKGGCLGFLSVVAAVGLIFVILVLKGLS